ncbi:MAG: tetratricopeptide repeat protein [Burkholderiaceae bacterium]
MNTLFKRIIGSAALVMVAASQAFAAVEDDVGRLQHEWERIKYQSAQADQPKQFEQLSKEAEKVTAQYPERAEPLIWYGIIEASQAGAKGGLGALFLVKHARQSFEKALEINPNALNGSAYTSLGSLYYQVPGWPIGFGDDKKALEFLEKGLAANPNGIDPNFFLGDYYFRNGDLDKAEQALKKALQAPARPNRKLADDGRRNEIRQLLDKIAEKRNRS